MPTNTANYEKIKKLLIAKECPEERINALLVDKVTNRDKEKALEPLCNEFDVHLEKKTRTPLSVNTSLKDYFGISIANLLVDRKKYLNLKEVKIDDIKTKTLDQMSADEKKLMKLYLDYEVKISELERVNSELKNKGITIE